MALHDYCGEAHGEVVTRLAHVERNCEELEDRLGKHCTNGGTGHVQRGEFARLETQVADLRRVALYLIAGVLVASGGGSAFGPKLLELILGK